MNRVFGSYILDERIGVGGMGEVYRATKSGPEGFEARVALKLILPHLAREASFRRLFSREARLAALLKHPNIVSVSGFDILDGSPFIEMEYVEGSDLASLLKNLGDGEILPLEEAVHIIHYAARGLAYAHSFDEGSDRGTGIVHRDFNPHNLLISVEGEVKITDFGIARAAMGGTATSNTLMGKLAYMSPEQVEGKQLDHRSDLFSLGIAAYQLLTGRHPFQRASEAGTVRALQEASFRPISESVSPPPSSLSDTVDSLLSVSPEDRPDSARHVADVFEEYLKPASAKMLGRRIRQMSNTSPRAPAAGQTAPTLPLRSGKHQAWLLALIVPAVAVIMGLWKMGEPPPDTTDKANNSGLIEAVSARQDKPAMAENGLDEAVVLITSDPAGARVSEKDKALGYTPLSVTLPAGALLKELTLSLDRYEPADIQVTRDNTENGVALTLTPLPTGTLRIGAIPWARVRFMGEDMGITPVVIEDVQVGALDLVLFNSELGVSREVKVDVREGLNPVFVLDMSTGKTVQSLP